MKARDATYTKGRSRDGWVAQLAEQWTENPRVGGSIPPPATSPFSEANREENTHFAGIRDGGIARVAFRSCFYTQFDEFLALPLLVVLLFGLLRMRITD